MYHKKQKKPAEPTVLKVTVKKVEKPKSVSNKPSAVYVRGMELLRQLKKDFAVIRNYQPLVIGIAKDLQERYPDVPNRVINTALHIHTKTEKYLTALIGAVGRFDLDGKQQSDVDVVAVQLAEQKLTALKQRVKNARANIKPRVSSHCKT